MIKNPRITPKERGLLKGAIRRVFSRSDLRREVVELSVVDHVDATRHRVKKWSRCFECKGLTPTYLIVIDHICPIVPINQSFENMSLDVVVDRAWCEKNNLQPLCKACHNVKTKAENKERRLYKKGLK